MRILRVYTGEDERSHFEDIEVGTGRRQMGLYQHFLSPELPARSVLFHDPGDEGAMPLHNAPARLFQVALAGRLEIEVGDGSKRSLGPGEIVMFDDRTGEGHITRHLEGPRSNFIVYLPDDFDVKALGS